MSAARAMLLPPLLMAWSTAVSKWSGLPSHLAAYCEVLGGARCVGGG